MRNGNAVGRKRRDLLACYGSTGPTERLLGPQLLRQWRLYACRLAVSIRIEEGNRGLSAVSHQQLAESQEPKRLRFFDRLRMTTSGSSHSCVP